MAKGTFGERLKRERELREVKLDEVASATRIAPRFIEALENEEWEKLPGGVFGRGFVRSIARYLGLSEENLLSEYDLARGEVVTAAPLKPEERIPSAPKWVPALAVIVLIAVLLGLIYGARYAWKMYGAHHDAKKASAVVSLPLSPTAQTLLRNVSTTVPAAIPATTIPANALELSITAASASRVRALSDSLVVFDAEVGPSENLRFVAKDNFQVPTADSSAVLLELNGQTVPTLGRPGSSVQFY
jgi:cytoskeleton protein RodZ